MKRTIHANRTFNELIIIVAPLL